MTDSFKARESYRAWLRELQPNMDSWAIKQVAQILQEKDAAIDAAQAQGRKFDVGKPRPGLLAKDFANALLKISEVAAYGAKKYDDSNWSKVENGPTRYTDALFRHLLQYLAGEANDEESELPHLAHAAWNMLCVTELAIRKEFAMLGNTYPPERITSGAVRVSGVPYKVPVEELGSVARNQKKTSTNE